MTAFVEECGIEMIPADILVVTDDIDTGIGVNQLEWLDYNKS